MLALQQCPSPFGVVQAESVNGALQSVPIRQVTLHDREDSLPQVDTPLQLPPEQLSTSESG